MRRQWVGAALAAVLAALAAGTGASSQGAAPAGGAKRPFAVVELFTSQGCDSCPPADKVLAGLVAGARKDGRRVLCLSFHVDYWDRLGWKDPYGGPPFTSRQRAYGKALRLRGVYTPQMVVNGQQQFVGSDGRAARQAVESALKAPAEVGVRLTLAKGDAVKLSYALSAAPKGAVLNVALVERGLSNKVPRGENAGRALAHENVVRAWKTVELKGEAKGTVELPAPRGLVRKNASVIAFVQGSGQGAVLGAERVDLGGE